MEGTEETQQVENQDELDYISEDDYSDEDLEDDYDYGGSEPQPLAGIYGLFKDVKDAKDTKRVSNLKDEELGIWDISVRDCERVAA